MAVGDVVSAVNSVLTVAFLDIQPGAGVEWVIHNIYHEADVTVEYFDGTNSVVFYTGTVAGALTKHAFHVNNTRRVRVKNTNAATKLIAYDGIITK